MFTRSCYARRSRKCKKTDDLTAFLRIWDLGCVKAVRKTLAKLTPRVHNLKTTNWFKNLFSLRKVTWRRTTEGINPGFTWDVVQDSVEIFRILFCSWKKYIFTLIVLKIFLIIAIKKFWIIISVLLCLSNILGLQIKFLLHWFLLLYWMSI